MEVTFTKTESGCTTRCLRSDGSCEEWESPDGVGIPHDLVHWIVETKLNLTESFYGNIAAGQDHYSVNELAHSDTELASTELLVLLIQNETATRNGVLHADPEAIRGMYGLQYPEFCGHDARQAIIDAIDAESAAWAALKVGHTVTRMF